MKTDAWVDVMLPKYFHYHGMNKIKAGKGYRDGRPIGMESGTCEECGGTIIALQMNTSRKGFETTSEKVCDTCGLVVPLQFTILDKVEKHYKARPYDTHESWIEHMKQLGTTRPPDESGVAWDMDLYEHNTGHRMSTSDDQGYEVFGTEFKNINESTSKIDRLEWKFKNTPKKVWRNNQYKNMVQIIAGQMQLNQRHKRILIELMEEYGPNHFNRRMSYEDIIEEMCLYFIGEPMNKTIQQRMDAILL